MKKTHETSASQLTDLELARELGENRFVQWISQHGVTAVLSIVAALLVLGIGYRLISGGSAKAEADYINAENDFVVFKRGTKDTATAMSQDEAFKKLDLLIKAHPDLNAKYDGLIAQLLINRDQLDQAQVFVDRTLARTSGDHLPFYADYAETSLLISKQQYQDALLKALQLKQQMVDSRAADKQAAKKEFGDTLFAFNLLRIAILEQQVGTPSDELKAWQTLKGSAKEFKLLQDHFAEGKVSLSNYIEAREKVLK